MTGRDERLAAFMRDVEKAQRQLDAFTASLPAVPAAPRDLDDFAAWLDRLERDAWLLGLPAPATARPVDVPRPAVVRAPSPDAPADLHSLQARLAAIQAGRQKGGRHSKDKARRERARLTRQIDAAVTKLGKQGKKASLSDAARDVYRTTRSEWWNTLTYREQEREVVKLVRRYHREKAAAKKG